LPRGSDAASAKILSALGWLEPITGSRERCHGGQPGAASPQGGSEPKITDAAL
jgi:hypothetical protein